MTTTREPLKAGDRAGAIIEITDKTVVLAGYGVYQGALPVGPEAVGLFAEAARAEGVRNPCILLDSGDRIWGCECWWGSETKVKENIEALVEKGRRLVRVSIADERKRHRDACDKAPKPPARRT